MYICHPLHLLGPPNNPLALASAREAGRPAAAGLEACSRPRRRRPARACPCAVPHGPGAAAASAQKTGAARAPPNSAGSRGERGREAPVPRSVLLS